MTENDWECLGGAPLPRDNGTAEQRDNETAKTQKKRGHRPQYPVVPSSRSPEVPSSCRPVVPKSRSPTKNSVFLSPSQPRGAVRGSLASEVVRCGASQKNTPRDSTKTYSPRGVTFGMCRRLRLITPSAITSSYLHWSSSHPLQQKPLQQLP